MLQISVMLVIAPGTRYLMGLLNKLSINSLRCVTYENNHIINKYKTSLKGKCESVFHISIACACGLLVLHFVALGLTLPSVFSSIKLVFICDFALVLYWFSSAYVISQRRRGK